jgi:hypothetical protein
MLPNWTGWKTVKMVLTGVALAAGSIAVGKGLPDSVHAIAAAVGQINAAALAVVIMLSGTAAGPTITKN